MLITLNYSDKRKSLKNREVCIRKYLPELQQGTFYKILISFFGERKMFSTIINDEAMFAL